MVFRAQLQTTVILTSSMDRWRRAAGRNPPTYAHSSPGLTKAKKHPHTNMQRLQGNTAGAVDQCDERRGASMYNNFAKNMLKTNTLR